MSAAIPEPWPIQPSTADLPGGAGEAAASCWVMRVGILGGMGPAATADFYTKLIRITPAGRDQDHLPVVIWADPRIPDRSAALLGVGVDPTPWLVRGTRHLVSSGADLIAVPCNTAHAFLDAVRAAATPVPVLDMITETVADIARRCSAGAAVGVLATTGTLTTGLYQRALGAYGLRPVVPRGPTQEGVMRAIHEVKAGRDPARAAAQLAPALRELDQCGAEMVVAACTEVPLMLTDRPAPMQVVDATAVLAQVSVSRAMATDATT